MQKHEVSESVVRRLPRYYRLLQELERQGQAHTSSRELGKRLGMTASQIRQDLSCFGCFGQQGYGYSVTELRENLERIMGLPQLLPAILVGAGNLGQVVAENVRFEQRGFRLIGIFDIKPELVGNQMAGLEIQPMEQLEAFCAQQSLWLPFCAFPRKWHRIPQSIWSLWAFGDCGISATATSLWSTQRS